MRPILALLLLPPLTGCFLAKSQVNHPLDPAAFETLEPGSTSARRAVELLGAPTEIVQLGRRSAYRYDHTRTKQAGAWLLLVAVTGTDTQHDRAWLFFDENDVLTHVGTTFAASKAKYAPPPVDLSDGR